MWLEVCGFGESERCDIERITVVLAIGLICGFHLRKRGGISNPIFEFENPTKKLDWDLLHPEAILDKLN